jgi:hypothetical protein
MIELAALESQAIDFGVLYEYWRAIEVASGASIQPEPVSKGATAPTCAGLTTVANDGERLGRLAWVPGAR